MVVLLNFGLLVLASFVLVGGYRVFAAKYVLDIPNDRSMHVGATPRGGGLVIGLISIGVISYFSTLGQTGFLMVGIGGSILVLVGFWDDLFSTKAIFRLAVHVGVASLCVFQLNALPEFPIKGLGSEYVQLFAVFAVVWSINLFNFMDGINGIAASEAMCVLGGAALILFLQDSEYWEPIFFLIPAVIGFLIWNFPVAKVFMGDAGSTFLGFIIAILAIITSETDAISPWSWFILYAMFWVDASYTLVKRVCLGKSVFTAHREHLYQKAALAFGSHVTVSIFYCICNLLILIPLAVFASFYYEYSLEILIVCALIMFYLCFVVDRFLSARIKS